MNKKYLWLAIPWAVALLLAGGWALYWNTVAGEAERRLNAAIAEQQADGATASIGSISRHGFPAIMRLQLNEVSYAPARGGWRARTDRVDLHINLMNTEHVTIKAEAPIAIAREDGSVTNVAADTIIGSFRTANGALAQAGVEADNMTLDDPNEDGVLTARKLVINVRPDARAAGEYQLSFDATELLLPRPVRSFEAFGQEVAALRAAIVIEQGAALLESAPGDPTGPWREAGGRLRFEALALNWGPLQATGTGFGGLDSERRLTGDLELPIEEPAPIFTALAQAPDTSEDARRALGLLAAAFAISGDDIDLDVEAEGGVLRLEGLSVRELPPVY
ncbi:DUF2125 domain-containing protein [Vitreimonas flagellata]|uniref:DUF2125 domain-containing protein n=1 Tax=Vitreimonas flagellata TaxID=2560861 RepID=UPI00107584D0|nr:DUF2125 domain-containing protein [Vitreimonas flagellata]